MWWHTRRNQYFVFRRKGRVHLNRPVWASVQSTTGSRGVCASAAVMLDTPCSEVVWRVLATHCIHQFPLHFPLRASPCAITFQLESTHCIERLGGPVRFGEEKKNLFSPGFEPQTVQLVAYTRCRLSYGLLSWQREKMVSVKTKSFRDAVWATKRAFRFCVKFDAKEIVERKNWNWVPKK